MLSGINKVLSSETAIDGLCVTKLSTFFLFLWESLTRANCRRNTAYSHPNRKILECSRVQHLVTRGGIHADSEDDEFQSLQRSYDESLTAHLYLWKGKGQKTNKDCEPTGNCQTCAWQLMKWKWFIGCRALHIAYIPTHPTTHLPRCSFFPQAPICWVSGRSFTLIPAQTSNQQPLV